MPGRSGQRGRRVGPPETTEKRESSIFRPWSISAYSHCTIAPSEAGILARSAGHRTQFSLRLARAAAQRGSTSRCSPWSKPVNHLKNAPEQIARHGDLRHLEGRVAPVDDELRANLHELFPQASQRPFLDAVRQRQRPQEVCKLVREGVKLKPDGVGGERAA